MKQTVCTITVLFVMALYQNMDLVSAEFVNLHKIDEDKRSAHARELLGSEYFDSEADHARDITSLNQQIYNQFRERLPKAYKSRAMEFTNVLIEEASKEHIDPVLVMAVITVESRFNPKAQGTSGEMGLMQLLPETAAWIAKKTGHSYRGGKALFSPEINIVLGVRYISFLRKSFGGESYKYISAYNMGPGNVRKLLAQNTIPKIYNGKVMKSYKNLYTDLVYGGDVTTQSTWQVAGH